MMSLIALRVNALSPDTLRVTSGRPPPPPGVGALMKCLWHAVRTQFANRPILHAVRSLFLYSLLFAAIGVNGQVAGVRPPNPTSLDFIIIDVDKPDLDFHLRSVEIVGSEIRITFAGYPTTPAFARDAVPVGRLAPGSYSILVTFIYEDTFGNPTSTTTLPAVPLQIAEGSTIPVLDGAGLIALAFALSVIAIFVLSRNQ